jgi:hypothetical protein
MKSPEKGENSYYRRFSGIKPQSRPSAIYIWRSFKQLQEALGGRFAG